MPGDVIDLMGYALYLAQRGLKHQQAKVLKGFGSAAVLEVVEDDMGGTYRAIRSNSKMQFMCFIASKRNPIRE